MLVRESLFRRWILSFGHTVIGQLSNMTLQPRAREESVLTSALLEARVS